MSDRSHRSQGGPKGPVWDNWSHRSPPIRLWGDRDQSRQPRRLAKNPPTGPTANDQPKPHRGVAVTTTAAPQQSEAEFQDAFAEYAPPPWLAGRAFQTHPHRHSRIAGFPDLVFPPKKHGVSGRTRWVLGSVVVELFGFRRATPRLRNEWERCWTSKCLIDAEARVARAEARLEQLRRMGDDDE